MAALAALGLLRGRGIRVAIGATARIDLHRGARAGPGVEVDLVAVAGPVTGSAIRGSPSTH